MTVIRVTDRTWQTMQMGAWVDGWPDHTPIPSEGERVVIFDRELDFTQHEATSVEGRRVVLGPAIPWDGS